MSKVSYPTSVVVGLAGPKEHPKGASDGEQVNIPALQVYRYYDAGTHMVYGEVNRYPHEAQNPRYV